MEKASVSIGAATFAATLLLEQDIHAKIASVRPGHPEISLALNNCSHVLPGMQDRAAEMRDCCSFAVIRRASQDMRFSTILDMV